MNKKISHLHYITQDIPGKSHEQLALQVCQEGIDWLQLRVKNKSYNEYLEIAQRVAKICNQYNVKLIINDNVSIANEVKAAGVHLGKTDMNPTEARKLLGKNCIIGGTANTFEDIEKLVQEGVDYIGLGPFRFTATKENLSPILGLQGCESIVAQCKKFGITIPIIAIGGIKIEDVETLMDKGVYGIAVSSAINLAENTEYSISSFKNKISASVTPLREKIIKQ